jgi:hypothetical protein
MANLNLGELKAHLLVVGDDQDTRLQIICNGVNSRIASATSRDWKQDTRIETYRGTGTDALCLRHWPIAQLLGLSVDGTEWDVDDEDVVSVNGQDGILYRTDEDVWPRSRKQNISVTYIGGPDVVPEDLRLAALEMAVFVFQASGGRKSVDAGSSQISMQLVDQAMEKLPTVQRAIEDHADWMRGYYRGG